MFASATFDDRVELSCVPLLSLSMLHTYIGAPKFSRLHTFGHQRSKQLKQFRSKRRMT